MAAIAGVSTEVATACKAREAATARRTGQTAIVRALAPIAATAAPAAERSERTLSTIHPPGTWLKSPASAPTESTSPMSVWLHFCVAR
jgi:hypothetical protein